MPFSPIAIIGRSCVLPGALTPDELWDAVLSGRDLLTNAPADRWGIAARDIVRDAKTATGDCAFTDRGGYVVGFDRAFDSSGFAIPASDLIGLDPLFTWVLHTAREALIDGRRLDRGDRTGAILGNLSFPSSSMSAYAANVWLDSLPGYGSELRRTARLTDVDPRNRFMSGLPALLLAKALKLSAGAFAIDAACASSLYAISLACDQLHDGRADTMLAGAVNRADDLFIHVGFSALSALSPSGRSRPFHRSADGLVPSEGAGFVVLRRLADARRDGDPIHGVIRGIGLSNDGRGRGLLAPAEEGQTRAIRAAYARSGIDPATISLVECHATGTQVGDATEIRSMASVFAEAIDLPIGSLKSNLGHLVTTAGVAGVIKVLQSMRAELRPPTLHVDQQSPALDDTPFRVLRAAESWPTTGPRRAGVSAFGFGGNNAHLVLEQYDERHCQVQIPGQAEPAEPAADPTLTRPLVAIVGLGVVTAGHDGRRAFTEALFDAEDTASVADRPAGTVSLPLAGLRFPPRDLEQSLGQQTLVLRAASEAVAEVGSLPAATTGVFIGMGADPEVARYGVRWRLLEWAKQWEVESADWLKEARDAVIPLLEAPGVIGTMPNMPANRLNSQYDLRGPSMTVSAEEISGLCALDVARRALEVGELDAALVGAVDLSCEPVHAAAATALFAASRQVPGDAAVVLVLKRLADAERDHDRIYATLTGDSPADALQLGLAAGSTPLTPRLGHAHAASALTHVAAAALALHGRTLPSGQPWIRRPGIDQRAVEVVVETFAGPRSRVALVEHTPSPGRGEERAPRLHVFSGLDSSEVLANLELGQESDDGPARLVLIASSESELAQRKSVARGQLDAGRAGGEGIYYRDAPIGGEVAFVFAGAGSAYHGMGRSLLRALPELGDALQRRFSRLGEVLAQVFGDPSRQADASDHLWGASALSQLHMELTRSLGLAPQAAIGYSSGESNSLFATGIWTDMDAMRADVAASGMFSRELGGEFRAVARSWGEPVSWAMWAVRRDVDRVRTAIGAEPRVRLAIISSPEECVIAGDAAGCERVVERLGRDRCHRLGYEIAAHVPEVVEFRDPWLAVHRRHVTPAPTVRIYSNAYNAAYTPDEDACAEAIYAQALHTIEFPRTIERAYQDGVRVFVELGPRDSCSRWIRRSLGDRDAVVCALDAPGRGIRPLFDALAALVAGGVRVDHTMLSDRLQPHRSSAPGGPALTLSAHLPPVVLPPLARTQRSDDLDPAANPAPDSSRTYEMPPPPVLPPVGAELDPVDLVATPVLVGPPPVAPTVLVVAPTPPEVAPAGSAHADSQLADIFARLGTHMNRVGALHKQFIAQQQALHQQFLGGRQASVRALVAAVEPGTVAVVKSPLGSPSPVPPSLVVDDRRTEPVAPITPLRTSAVDRPEEMPPVAPPTAVVFDRRQLEVHASARISEIFGRQFERQDGYHRQVRMPEPPLLLADRVVGLDAEPGTMGLGSVTTETDVRDDSWYLNQGYMPAGIMIESGQADLMLISYLGIDFHNKGERVYRLLGCQLTYHRGLPKPGETLRYDIHVDGHANQGPVRLFFFHYDCRVDGELRLAVRAGQAGFFTDQELADSAGVLWSPEEQELNPSPRLDPPAVPCTRQSFTHEQVRSFADGDALACFGPGFELASTHVRSPRIQSGRLLFLDHVAEVNPTGGPWGRGYLRAETPVHADDFYFEGHFKNDPCMPGNFMFEGCLQAMSFYLTALGFTLKRDGWRFQPVADQPFDLRCRGQVIPTSKHLTYELFVEEVIAGPAPTVYGDLLVTCDGLKAFHARRVGLELVPDWPLTSRPELLADYVEPRAVARRGDFEFGYASLLACAWGRPSQAFGPMYGVFDGYRKVARLPGPPYHFMTRVTRLEGEIGALVTGGVVEIEYDIPPDAWYFTENGAPTMPFAVLLEAALQPCGWLASFVGSALVGSEDLKFRNLDGTGTLLAELNPAAGTLRTVVHSKRISRSAGMILESFDVECFLGDERVYVLDTGFGFFPDAALENQVGLSTSDEQRTTLTAASDYVVDLTTSPARYCGASARLARPMLLMLDRITGFWPTGGANGLGHLRAEKDVDPSEWFFKAHFFQDPVQPGSLGIEAMVQLLQFYMLERGLDSGIPHARFESLALDVPLTWKYRGQVIPTNRVITTTMDIVEVGHDERGPFAIATSSLWVDGKRIYEASNLGMRIVAGTPPPDQAGLLDPAVDRWLLDHRPTWNRPALPMMTMVDELSTAVAGRVTELVDVKVERWCDFPGPRRLRVAAAGDRARLWATTVDGGEEGIASAMVRGGDYAAPPPPLSPLAGEVVPAPYASGALFHGPSFQLMTSLVIGSEGSSSVLDLSRSGVPAGKLNPALLDGATHGIPHDRLDRWDRRISADKVAYPVLIESLRLFGATPREGEARVEARFDGFLSVPDFPRLRVQIIVGGRVWAEMRLVERCFAKGPLGSVAPADRQAFLRDHVYVPGVRLSRWVEGVTRLSAAEVAATDWMPGTVEGVYGTREVAEVASKEHIAVSEHIHPGKLPQALPLTRFAIEIAHDGDDVCVRTTAPSCLDLTTVREWWSRYLGTPRGWLGDDLWTGILDRYVNRVVVADPDSWQSLGGRPVIFVGNHQVQIESLLITNLLAVLSDRPVRTMANKKHERGWIGWLLGHLWSYPGCRDPRTIVYFDQAAPQTMAGIVAELEADLTTRGMSFFVHAQGTRSQSCRDRVSRMSSLFIDLALKIGAPIVPVRFVGGLPIEPIEGKLELPWRHGKQDYWIGSAIAAAELAEMPFAQRSVRVQAAINDLGPAPEVEAPHSGEVEFAAEVAAWQQRTGVGEVEAALFKVLDHLEQRGAEGQRLVEAASSGRLRTTANEQGRWLAGIASRLLGSLLTPT